MTVNDLRRLHPTIVFRDEHDYTGWYIKAFLPTGPILEMGQLETLACEAMQERLTENARH